jgi:hypothetical protein
MLSVANQVGYTPAVAPFWGSSPPTKVASSDNTGALDLLALRGPQYVPITSLSNGANNNFNPGTAPQFAQEFILVVEPGATTAPFSFTGFLAPVPVNGNCIIEITNESSFPMSLNNNNIGSIAGNRILNATDFDLQNIVWARLRYDEVNSAWWVDDWSFAEQAIPANIGSLVSVSTSSITLAAAGSPTLAAPWSGFIGPTAASGSSNNAALQGSAVGGTIQIAQPGTYRVDCTISAVAGSSDVYKLIITVNGVAAQAGIQTMAAGQAYTLTTPTLVQPFNPGDVIELQIEPSSTSGGLFNWIGSLTVDQRY